MSNISDLKVSFTIVELTIITGTIDKATLDLEQKYDYASREELFKNSSQYRRLLKSQKILADAYTKAKDSQ